MTILHIAHVGEDPFSGVNVAVPQQILAQADKAWVGFVNLTGVSVQGIRNQFPWRKGMQLRSLPEPFCRPDLVVFHEIYRPAFAALSRQVRAMGIPYVIVPHGSLTVGAQRKKAYKKIPANLLVFRDYLRSAAAIQCLSQRELEQTRFPGNKFIGTNGITLTGRKAAFSRDGQRFVYIGRLEYGIKGLDLMMEALGRERELLLRQNCRVDLYGPDVAGALQTLEQDRKRLGLEQIVSFHAPLAGEEKQRILSGADCYIQTSRSEGMSMGILEALGWGLPCLVTRGTGMADLVREKQAGWGCETDPESIAGAIRQAVADRARLVEMSANARQIVEASFTWEQVGASTLERYRSIAGERN